MPTTQEPSRIFYSAFLYYYKVLLILRVRRLRSLCHGGMIIGRVLRGRKNEIKHNAPLTPRSTQPTGLFKRAAYSKELQAVCGTLYRRLFRGEGATANFRAALTDTTVSLPRTRKILRRAEEKGTV